MKLSGARAERFVKDPASDALGVLFFGPDRGLVSARSATLAPKWADNIDDPFSVTQMTADDLSADPAKLSDDMSAMSLMGGQRLIRLRLDHEKSAKAIASVIEHFDADPSRSAARLIIEAGDMTPRSVVRKAFEKAKYFFAVGCYPPTAQALASTARDRLSAAGKNISPEALDVLLPFLEGDFAASTSELDKLILYMGDETDITPAHVKAISVGGAEAGLDDIVNAALGGDVEGADAALQKALASKLHPASVLRALQRNLMRLHQAVSAVSAGQSLDQAMKSLRPPVFIMQKQSFIRQARGWRLGALTRALDESLDAERQIKSTGSADTAILGRLILAISLLAKRQGLG